MTTPNKVDSNVTGLAYSEEASIGVLNSGTLTDGTVLPIFYGLEPNSYKDFGADVKVTARKPITATRQHRKGTVTDLTASGGFTQDLTVDMLPRLMQGFLYANAHEKRQTAPMGGTAYTQGRYPITAVTTSLYDVAVPTFVAGDLVFAQGFSHSANNGLKVASGAVAATSVSSSTGGLAAEASPPTTASLTVVGVQFAAGDAGITATAHSVFPQLTTTVSTGKDLTTLGLNPGEWVFIGGDVPGSTGNAFPVNPGNNGFARIYSIATNAITFDKTQGEMITEVAGSATIQMFFGTAIKTEPNPVNIVRRTYSVERQLGFTGNTFQAVEYLVGAVPNEMMIAVKASSLVTVDTTFMAIQTTTDDGSVGPVTATRVAATIEDAINTVSDFTRMNIGTVSPVDSSIKPLFVYVTDLSLTLKNNDKEDKAIGILGAFDVTTGSFELTASITAYFNDTAAVAAVKANPDVTVDFTAVKANRGIVFDVPLVSLGGGRLNVVQDTSIMIPMTIEAGMSPMGHTFMFGWFPYLPNLAE